MSNPTDGPDFAGRDEHGGEDQQALDAVRAVVAFYSSQILDERRAPLPDEARMDELKAARQGALDDQARLDDVEPAEAARIASLYAARLQELNGQ
ncbi:hypothetical protein [Streptomyces sp. H27-S2]|uniref:hypothetical protein n=1 Tax=Streptomyces antarcticus TaxID=2996458 RepID=UPI0022710819|nr:hypothetical protein [Streptomyces sp. H27-S2]MCY0954123.1 hypothetical protein [Streptomyces sp. H27-S2]